MQPESDIAARFVIYSPEWTCKIRLYRPRAVFLILPLLIMFCKFFQSGLVQLVAMEVL